MFEKIKKNIKNNIKGTVGETKINLKLSVFLPAGYLILNNVTIPNGDRFSQIDHIVVSKSGIFVIETKNYSGWIHGQENSQNWTQSFYNSKNQFYNPIKQNKTHIAVIKSILSEAFPNAKLKFHSIIVFTGEAELKNVYTKTPVIHLKDINKEIKKIKDTYLSDCECREIFEFLSKENLKDWKTKRTHVKNIKNNEHKVQRKVSKSICLKCGGVLKKKKGKYGEFLGCNNFPKCRYIHK